MVSPTRITEGEFAGWKSWHGLDPFETLVGPFYFREAENGEIETAFRVEEKHLNGLEITHGGLLMTFADYCLFAIAWPRIYDTGGVTVQLAGDFNGPAMKGELVVGRGKVTKAGRSLVFARGETYVGDRVVLPWSGIIKRLPKGISKKATQSHG